MGRNIIAICWILLSGCAGVNSRTELLNKRVKPVALQKPQIDEWKLSNGLHVMFVEDREVPIVEGKLYLKGGSLWEPKELTGVVGAMGSQMRSGGAGVRSAEELDIDLEKLAASIGSGFGGETGSVGFSCLSSDFEKVFPIFSDVVLRPRFEKARFDLWKGQTLENIRRRIDDSDTVASIAFGQLLYGETPYGRVLVEADVKRLTRDHLVAMHKKFVRPNEAILVITGGLDLETVKTSVEEKFGSWKQTSWVLPPPPPVDTEPPPGIYFIELPFVQSTIIMGHLGVKRLSPDYPAIDTLNQVFGTGGMSCRLMLRIREQLGLAYGAYGSIDSGVVKGKNSIFVKTKSETTGSAIIESINVLREMQNSLVSIEELNENKDSIENSFVFNFESPLAILNRMATIQLLQYPTDFNETYIGRILEVSQDDIQNTAKKRWDISKFVIVVVGDENAYNSLGKSFENPPEELKHLIRKVKFTEKLIF